MLSTCPFIHLCIRALVCYQTYEHDSLKTNEPIVMAKGHKWSLRQGQLWARSAVNFGCQEVSDQGHIGRKIGLEAWQRHHSQSLCVKYVF